MGLRNMLILLAAGCVAVLALALYVLLAETGPPPSKEQETLVFPVKDAKNRTLRDLATKVEIVRGKEAIVLEKVDAQTWRMKKPVDARADRSAALGILDTLKSLKFETTVQPASDTPEELAKFGLKEPRAEATFWLGDKATSFAVGDEKKGQRTYEKRTYVRVKGDPRIFVVGNEIAEKLLKDVAKLEKPEDTAKWVAAFRDKRAFDRERDPEKATALTVVTPTRTLALTKDAKAWSLTSPVADLADASKVSSLLSKARNLEAEHFVAEDPKKLADFGLDKPQLTCEVKAEDGTTMKVLVGASAPEKDEKLKDQLYAKRAEEPSVFTIKKDFLTDMDVKLDDIRDRKVASFEDSDVTGIEFTRGKDTWAVARESKDKDWKLTKPKDAAAYQSGVSDALRHLGKLRVARWIDDPKDPANESLKNPDAVVTLLREPKAKTGAKPQPPIKLYFSAVVKKEKPAESPKPKEPAKEEKEKKPEDKPKEKEFEEGRYVRREGQTSILYIVGGKAPDGASYDEKESIEAITALGKTLDKGHLAFLDRKIFDFKEDGIVRLTIERDSLKLACEKKDGNWKLTSPVALDADKGNVSKITSTISRLTADELVAESPKPDDLKRYGLDTPALRITATIEEEEKKDEAKKEEKADEKKKDEKKEAPKKTTTKTLLVSRKIEGQTYAMEQGGNLVFTLRSYDADDLRSEVISTTLGDFKEDDATSLTIAPRGKPELVIEKEKDTWAIAKPAKAEADQEAVKKVIDALHDLKARRCIDYEGKDLAAHGLEPPEVVITVKIKDKPDLVLKLGKPVESEKDDPGSAVIKGDAKQVFLLAKGKVEDIVRSLPDLQKKPEPKKEEPKKEAPEPKAPEKKEPEKKATEK